MPPRWTHIAMAVNNIERSVSFYSSFCGFSVIRDRRPEGGGTVWLGPKPIEGEAPIFLLVILEGAVTFQQDHFGFECESREEVDMIAKRAEALGILESQPFDSGGTVGYWMNVRDPDGNLVEFTFGQPIKGLP